VTLVSSGMGDIVGIDGAIDELVVPPGYASGSILSDTSTYANTTFSMLGVTAGTYVWTWEAPGAAADDSFTLIIPTPVPEPSSLPLLTLPLGFCPLSLRARFHTWLLDWLDLRRRAAARPNSPAASKLIDIGSGTVAGTATSVSSLVLIEYVPLV
jgi:hypothetical protein